MNLKNITRNLLCLVLLFSFVSNAGAQEFETPESLLKQIMDEGDSFDLGLMEHHITALKIDPNNPMVLYAGSIPNPPKKLNGKVFVSTNAGVTWTEGLDGVNIIDISVDTQTPGIALATSGNYVTKSAELYRTLDFGKTWRSINHPLYNRYERPVFTRISPWNSSHFFGATTSTDKGYLYFSSNRANTWEDITCRYFEGPPLDIAFNPFVENDIIISIENHTERPPLMRSLDNGKTWKHMWVFSEEIVDYVKFDSDSVGTIHVGIRGKGLYSSYDNGESWVIRDQGLREGSSTNDMVVMDDGYYTIVSFGTSSSVYRMKNNKTVWEKFAVSHYGKSPQIERYGNFLYVGCGGVNVYWIEGDNPRRVE